MNILGITQSSSDITETASNFRITLKIFNGAHLCTNLVLVSTVQDVRNNLKLEFMRHALYYFGFANIEYL